MFFNVNVNVKIPQNVRKITCGKKGMAMYVYDIRKSVPIICSESLLRIALN